MEYRIVADSSANVLTLEGCNYVSVPLKIRTDREYVDDQNLNVAEMVQDLKSFKGKSGSSCPNVAEWLEAFGDAEAVFCVTITKNLSGSYNAARQAAQAYLEEHPDRKVYIFDSLSAGPELMMIVEKILECQRNGDDFDSTIAKVLDYQNHNHTLFCLESMMNLARNGRVPVAVAKVAGMLGIRIIGTAKGGRIEPIQKPRGAKKATEMMVAAIRARGFYDGACMRISHCFAQEQAQDLMEAIRTEFPNTRFQLEPTAGLCSYYAEQGGIIVGFQGSFNAENDNRKF